MNTKLLYISYSLELNMKKQEKHKIENEKEQKQKEKIKDTKIQEIQKKQKIEIKEIKKEAIERVLTPKHGPIHINNENNDVNVIDSGFAGSLDFNEASPSLEKIANASNIRVPTRRQRFLQEQNEEENKDESNDPFKYSAGITNKNEPRYTSREVDYSELMLRPEQIDVLSLGKTNTIINQQTAKFMNWESPKEFESRDKDLYLSTKRVDFEKEKTDQFKKQDVKYKPMKY